MTTRSIELEVVGWGPTHSFCTADVVHYNPGGRLVRSLRALALIWIVAIPLMLVPYAVVIVLPAAMALSVYFCVQHMRAENVATSCTGTCPDCGIQQRFDLPERFRLPMEIQCGVCHRELWLRKRTAMMAPTG